MSPSPAVALCRSQIVAQPAVPRGRDIGDVPCISLVEFQRQLLSKHQVTDWDAAFRDEAERANWPAPVINLFDIQLLAVPDAVALAGIPAGNLEKSVPNILLALHGRQVVTKQL
jgi:hypothetical protein